MIEVIINIIQSALSYDRCHETTTPFDCDEKINEMISEGSPVEKDTTFDS